jgi:hypothetical protein
MLDVPLTMCALLSLWACDQTLLLALAVFVLLQVLDVWTTRRALAAGGQELNPLANWAMAQLGEVPGLVVIKAVLGLLLLYALAHLPYAQGLASVLVNNAIYTVVVISNLRVARSGDNA